MHSPVSAEIENLLLWVIVQLIVIIAAARIFGVLFRKMGQPQVCGEIAAGLIVGPSLFGRFFPGAFKAVLQSSTAPIFSIISQIGLILLMFLIGLEFDFEHVNENRKTAIAISIAGVALPFSLGYGLGHYIHDTGAAQADPPQRAGSRVLEAGAGFRRGSGGVLIAAGWSRPATDPIGYRSIDERSAGNGRVDSSSELEVTA